MKYAKPLSFFCGYDKISKTKGKKNICGGWEVKRPEGPSGKGLKAR